MNVTMHVEGKNRRKGWWAVVYIYVTLLLTGVSAAMTNFDLGKIRPAGETLGRYEMLLACAALLLTFFVPFSIFMYYSCRRMGVSWKMTILAFFSGWFMAGTFSTGIESVGVALMRSLTSERFVKAWAPPILGPIVEETLKLLVVVCLLALLGQHQRKQYLIAGMAVGMGFQIDESLNDIIEVVKGSHHAYVTAISYTVNDRIISCLGSHWCYTGVAAVGAWLLFRGKRKKEGILLLLTAYLDHCFRDLPFTSNTLCVGVSEALILVVLFYAYMETRRENQVDSDRSSMQISEMENPMT